MGRLSSWQQFLMKETVHVYAYSLLNVPHEKFVHITSSVWVTLPFVGRNVQEEKLNG